MSNLLSKTGITLGNTVRSWHVTQSIDAFTGVEAYDITLSGSLTYKDGNEGAGSALISDANGKLIWTGSSYFKSGSFSGSFQGDGSNITGVISSSYALSASHAPPGDNIATSDLTVDSTGTRALKTGGSLVTDSIEIQDPDGASLLEIRGDNTVSVPSGYFGVGTTNLGPGFGGHRVSISDNGNGGAIYITKGGSNGSSFKTVLSPSGGSTIRGLDVQSTNSTGVSKYGAYFNIRGSLTSNLAIFIDEGDIQVSTNGTKIGTATLQKIGFWNTTPIVQPTALTAANLTATDGTILTADLLINNMRIRINELEEKLSTAAGGSGLIA